MELTKEGMDGLCGAPVRMHSLLAGCGGGGTAGLLLRLLLLLLLLLGVETTASGLSLGVLWLRRRGGLVEVRGVWA